MLRHFCICNCHGAYHSISHRCGGWRWYRRTRRLLHHHHQNNLLLLYLPFLFGIEKETREWMDCCSWHGARESVTRTLSNCWLCEMQITIFHGLLELLLQGWMDGWREKLTKYISPFRLPVEMLRPSAQSTTYRKEEEEAGKTTRQLVDWHTSFQVIHHSAAAAAMMMIKEREIHPVGGLVMYTLYTVR